MSGFVEQIDALDSGALFSPCRRWRYLLWRRWDASEGACVFIGLNPSTADETMDDPTIRRCIGFARGWGYGSLWMLNAYAFRATDPKVMKAAGGNALGPMNNEYLCQAVTRADRVVVAWGSHCDPLRERQVFELLKPTGKTLWCLGRTNAGHPKHPLYLRADTEPYAWRPSGL